MKTLWHNEDRDELRRRVQALTPSMQPRWGRMNAPQMMAHVTDQLRMTLGEIQTKPIASAFRFFPLNALMVYWAPWPKGAPTLPELIRRQPEPWGTEIADFDRVLEAFGRRSQNDPWPQHPLFGRLSSRAWGVLGYRHVDHHFRQFGI